ncbi:forespore capture DNA-binding protein RefZ [Sporolactobacillus sp. CPB3-1]|uniref:Forespore capture DNA-binding protein RefZ n=1 Tax=Sporolactobacillus mangiferae TaxID=2940498 RepID=A0ABT0M715_9BACL|nr:forespore capture DNA-binding protein RefZ [Sporolactobacillus mangiferae]MCL1630637.1 forespore capture DNA-binding protein RefZ [Sporolactobacillus mangiferae]
MPAKSVNAASGRKSKEAVIRSALKLFNMSGYDGVSVRAIASDAGVNIALVSYYFGGKQGLLEHLMADFFEGYLETLEKAEKESTRIQSPVDQLVLIANRLISFQQQDFYLSRFVHREMTLDNQLVRELMASYLVKEKFHLDRIFRRLPAERGIHSASREFLIIQFRDLVIMPFLQPQYLREVFFMQPSQQSFRTLYMQQIDDWAHRLFAEKQDVTAANGWI